MHCPRRRIESEGENQYNGLNPNDRAIDSKGRTRYRPTKAQMPDRATEAQMEQMERLLRRLQYLGWGLWLLTALVIVVSHFWK
jgi:hypothetical protein